MRSAIGSRAPGTHSAPSDAASHHRPLAGSEIRAYSFPLTSLRLLNRIRLPGDMSICSSTVRRALLSL